MKRNIRRYFTPTAALLRRIGFYGCWLLFLLVLQSTLAMFERFAGALPALVCVAVAALGFFDSERVGAVAGVAAGWALDAWGGARVARMPLICFGIGYFCGWAAGRLIPRGIIPFGVCLGGVALLEIPVTAVYAAANYTGLRIGTLIIHTLLPVFLRTLLWGVPTALITRMIVRRVRKSEQTKGKNDELRT